MQSRSPGTSTQFGVLDLHSFYITRVLDDVALLKVGAVSDLESAEVLMRSTAWRVPGAYLIFHGGSRRVVRKLVRHAPAWHSRRAA